MVSDLRSCTMLSTLPLFYIAQSVNSDDRRTRIQGLRVIMLQYASTEEIPTHSYLKPEQKNIIFKRKPHLPI